MGYETAMDPTAPGFPFWLTAASGPLWLWPQPSTSAAQAVLFYIFFRSKMPGTDSLVLFSAEVELAAGQRTSLGGDAGARAGAVLGLVPKAAASQPSGKREQLDMITPKPLQDSASYAAPFFPAKSSVLTEICVDIKDIHWYLLCFPVYLCIPRSSDAQVRPWKYRELRLNN